jgi:hypothetical protein
MRCIFCKESSIHSRSIEHIIPESLGNTEHVLPPGIVCDSCNNYFARKVEKPALDSPLFLGQRARHVVSTKNRRIPEHPAVIFVDGKPIELGVNYADGGIRAARDNDEGRLFHYLASNEHGQIFIPYSQHIDEKVLARFLAKVAVEILVEWALRSQTEIDVLVNDPQIDPIRNFARRGVSSKNWPIHRRQIYGEDHVFSEMPYHHVLHEYTLLHTHMNELYAVIAIFGYEYAINMAGPEIEGYEAWLLENSGRSPLYNYPDATIPL